MVSKTQGHDEEKKIHTYRTNDERVPKRFTNI